MLKWFEALRGTESLDEKSAYMYFFKTFFYSFFNNKKNY